jgi:polysaccharide pyruvyl transferase WcaK-like protein
MRIGLITTLGTNIGDDFIRTGLLKVLQKVLHGQEIEFVPINKHKPYTVYPSWHPVRVAELAEFLPRGKTRAANLIGSLLAAPSLSKFAKCDAVVQCGAPVLWPGCHKGEWTQPLWRDVVGSLHERIPVFNLAAGSSYPWERQPASVEDRDDAEFLTTIHRYCRLTTVRDRLSRALFDSLGCPVRHLACSALLAAGDPKNGLNGEDKPILINYIPGGTPNDCGQGVDASVWRETVRELVARLRQRHKLAFICHNESERRAVADLSDGLPVYLPKTIEEYFEVAAGAKAGIFNRMHASVGFAGLGIPSIAVGADTRLLMVEHIGLPFYYLKDAATAALEDKLESLLMERAAQRERLLNLRRETLRSYVEAISSEFS